MNQPIATLSMYDWPETTAALDEFWTLISERLKERGITAPSHLEHVDEQMPLWTAETLVVGQTCGWPYANNLRGLAIPFARFDYGLDDCPRGFYRSVYIGQDESDAQFIENAEALSTCPRVAINGIDSQSGFHVFEEIDGAANTNRIASEARMISGSHRNSVIAVSEGSAQIAAIDAVAFELAKRHESDAANNVKILGYSNPKPGLPLITSLNLGGRASELFEAVQEALSRLDGATKEALMIRSLVPAKDSDYEVFLSSQSA